MRYPKEKQKFQDLLWATSDHGSVARGKRNNRQVTGTNLDIKQKKGGELSGKSHTQSSSFDQHQRGPAAVSKETHGSVDRSTASQWQPKALKVSADDPQGSKPSGGKWVEVGDFRVQLEEPPKADATPNVQWPQKPRSESATGHSAKFSSRADYANEGGRSDFNVQREKRAPQNRRLTNQQETANPPAADEVQQKESEMYLGSFENQNIRYARGNNDSHADWNPRGHYRKQQQNLPSNRERPRPNSHYRYQPVGTEDIGKTGHFEGSTGAAPSKRGR
ncbi:hypothetical protein MLD38_039431 [Melastoma candidum]|uniref:Uncharacterized protein n=1 Tax=Melastoma candidum TaxID=119954 RepID=A0ACB9L2T1_9MYRT|nr:hypothetical protein MLD38_039431 [Melastoma candidum]